MFSNNKKKQLFHLLYTLYSYIKKKITFKRNKNMKIFFT